MRFILFICLFISLSHSIAEAAGIQKWVDENGRTQYGERPPRTSDASSVESSVSVVDAQVTETVVKLYSTRNCGYCKKAKAYMTENNIEFREYDIDKDALARARHKKLGGRGVPVIEIKGRTLHGFSRSRYASFFDI